MHLQFVVLTFLLEAWPYIPGLRLGLLPPGPTKIDGTGSLRSPPYLSISWLPEFAPSKSL